MKTKYLAVQIVSLVLAVQLQLAPLMRYLLPAQGLAPSAWAFILKIGVGATALLGFDAVSQASGISISPPNATVGTPYVGTVTYTGGHSGSVSSMSYSNSCLGSPVTFLPGLQIVYAGGNLASVSGTPTTALTNKFSVTAWDKASCPGSGEYDAKQVTTMVINPVGGSAYAPIAPTLQNAVAQVGSTVQLSGVSSGNPTPQYQWWTGVTPIPNATNSYLNIPNVQLTNAGLYTLTASNSQTAGGTIFTLPKGNCYLSAAISGGTNFTSYLYTNYAPAGVALTMYSFLTNGTSTTTNYYQWIYNGSPTPVLSTSNTLPLAASILTPSKSGTYTVTMNSTNSGGGIVVGQNYDSYWAFGYVPIFTNSLPASTNVSPGSSVTFSLPVGGTLNYYNPGSGGYQTSSVPCLFWYQNGTNLVASQIVTNNPTTSTTYSNTFASASLTLSNVSATNSGNYAVVATNFWGSTTSSPVALSVVSSATPPVITANPPAALSLLAGQSATLNVTATGTPTLYYQWFFGGANLANGGVYGGVQTNALTLTSATVSNSGNYTVVITNTAGAVTSSVASLNIVPPPSISSGIASPGNILVNASTITGLTYVVESATNLAAPVWVPVVTNNTGNGGAVSFQTNAINGAAGFYRLRFP
jgi:hypothetical protein